VCRCEGVSAGEVRAAIDDGAATVSAVRGRTRLGMGPCQGRMCGQACAELVARGKDLDVSDVGRIRARTPARPLPLGDLVQ
jgi:bacterioferritin-associated ferredoxin